MSNLETFDDFVKEMASKKYVKNLCEDETSQKYRMLILASTLKRQKKGWRGKRKKSLGLNAIKKLNLLELAQNQRIYELYIPLHQLWLDYMENLLEKCKDPKEIERRVSKADFHGAEIKVFKSTNPSVVGIQGILLMETKNMFNIITKNNQLKKIAKFQTTFSMGLNDKIFLLTGDNLRFKASERSVKNFKNKLTVQLVSQETISGQIASQ